MSPIIEVKNIGKRYDINRQRGGYVSLRDVLTNILRSPFAFIKTKAKQAAGLSKKEDFWALKGVNFSVERGEIVGIIGANGAGKSTLLKILSQITPPTEGEIRIRGRVGSLLEVGTGFHPELSGRENIFLNGAILGMTQKEVARKFDEIVAFAGVEKFLDTPVKYYSSGMYVRLAFSVAAHMEPDILIVDEVLAVGDAEFQKKCLGKMDEVTKQEGRTILFVSHNLDAIERLCTKTILLQKGEVVKQGKTAEVINYYLNTDHTSQAVTTYPAKTNTEGYIAKISIIDASSNPISKIPINEGFGVEVEYEIRENIMDAILSFSFYHEGEMLLNSSNADKDAKIPPLHPGKYKTSITIPPSLFNVGYYALEVAIKRPFVEFIDRKENIQFEITNTNNPRSIIFRNQIFGKIALPLQYKTESL